MVGRSIDRRQLKGWLKRLQLLKTWQLIILLLLFSLGAASLLRLNNLGMVERREAVMVADEKGDEKAIKASLIELQHYVSSHMNTDLGNGVYLVKSYERDRAAALKKAQGASNPNSEVYKQASIECRSRFVGGVESFRNDYVQCVIDRVSALSGAQDNNQLNLPRADLYRFDFRSPLISFDPAGLMVAICVLIITVIIGRWIAYGILRLLLRVRYRAV